MNSCKRLWCAVVTRAVDDLKASESFIKIWSGVSPMTPKRESQLLEAHRIRNDAIKWFKDEEAMEVGSLEWICNHIGMSASKIRNRVLDPNAKT